MTNTPACFYLYHQYDQLLILDRADGNYVEPQQATVTQSQPNNPSRSLSNVSADLATPMCPLLDLITIAQRF